MSNLNEIIVRIKADTSNFDNPIDAVRGGLPQFWRGNDLEFKIGIFAGSDILSVANYANIFLAIRKMASDGSVPSANVPALMQKVCTSLDDSVSGETWNNGTKEHASISFSASESNIVPGDHWLSIWATTADSTPKIVTLCAGIIRVLEVGGGNASLPPEPVEIYYSAEECDGKFIPLTAVDGDVNLGTSDSVIPSQNAVKSYIDTMALESGSGEINTASNVGTGAGIFSAKVGRDMRFKTLKEGSNVMISVDASEITISSSGGGASEGMTNPMTAAGDIIVGGESGEATRLAKGTAGQILKIEDGVPEWSDADPAYTLPIATAETLGGIRPDGVTLAVNSATGILSASVLSDSWLPSSDAIGITVASSGDSYTAPADGWISVVILTTNSNGNFYLSVNDGQYMVGSRSYSAQKTICGLYPIAAGITFILTYEGINVANISMKFIYSRGAI
ncbi:MAG: hypothetical protein LBI56_04025 [Puniceicoccales bacterium]|jgi:hypothetical protein|nr:hypothetical protein [Puniceicoccales bacterium]